MLLNILKFSSFTLVRHSIFNVYKRLYVCVEREKEREREREKRRWKNEMRAKREKKRCCLYQFVTLISVLHLLFKQFSFINCFILFSHITCFLKIIFLIFSFIHLFHSSLLIFTINVYTFFMSISKLIVRRCNSFYSLITNKKKKKKRMEMMKIKEKEERKIKTKLKFFFFLLLMKIKSLTS
jgi:membrane-associated HD superfamily phosphohydrolase